MGNIKAQIRLERVARRLAKKSYKHLAPEEYKLIKLQESLYQLDKDKNKFWRYAVRNENGAATVEGNDWEFFY